MAQLTAEQRSKIMASIHSKGTKPEMMVRRYLFACGFRFRVNSKRLPGTPDIVLRKYRTCIFINGCFWHGHDNCPKFHLPKTNVEFWSKKISRNKLRDIEVQRKLAKMGWHVMTIWECQLDTKEKREHTLMRIEYTLNHIYLMDRKVNHTTPYAPLSNDEKHQSLHPINMEILHKHSAATKQYQLPEDTDTAMVAEEIHKE